MDPEAARRQEAQKELGCQAYETLDAMLNTTPAEVVVVATPSSLHTEHVLAVLGRGKHAIVEKPFALSLADADRMIAAAATAGRQLFVHHTHRFGKLFAFLRQTLESGKLGRVFHIGVCFHNYRLRSDWQTLTRYGGGELNNAGSHHLDLVLRLLDAPVREVLCDMKHLADAGDAEDHVKILMRAANGLTADVEMSTKAATTRQAPQWTILGDAGALTVDQGKAHLKYYDRAKVPPPQPQGTLAATDRKYTPEPNLPWCQEDVPAEGQSQGFYDGVHGTLRLDQPFRVHLNEVRQVVELIAMCRAQNPLFPGATPA